MINCAVWALARATDTPIEIVDTLLRRYVDHGWVTVKDDEIYDVTMPEAVAHVAPDLGFLARFHKGFGQTLAWWAECPVKQTVKPLMLLVTESRVRRDWSHAVIAQAGRVFDNQKPDGLPWDAHPYSRKKVYGVFRFFPC